MGGTTREYSCCSLTRLEPSSFCFMTGFRKNVCLNVWMFIPTPLLTCCRVVSPPCGLEEALRQHHVSTCPGSSAECGGGHTHILQLWPATASYRNPLCAFMHLLMEELKQWQNLRSWASLLLLKGGRKELVPSAHSKISWCLGRWNDLLIFCTTIRQEKDSIHLLSTVVLHPLITIEFM